jgi:hypothetical protein
MGTGWRAANQFAKVAVEVRLVRVAAGVRDVCEGIAGAHALGRVLDADQPAECLWRQADSLAEARAEMSSAPTDLRSDGLDGGRSAGGPQARECVVDLRRRRGFCGQTGSEQTLGDGMTVVGVAGDR